MAVTSHLGLLASSVAHTSSSIVDAWDHRANTTLCDSQSFNDYVHKFKRQSGFYKQFKGLPGGELAACLVGKTTTNRRKNRYMNILPYDHSRLKLQSGDCQRGNDYINASYINGYGKPCFFIASQGPLQDTIPDFWNMVLQTGAPTIVMLTNLHENGKVMCRQYWPDLECVDQYGDFRVQTVREMAMADYTIRAFSISQKGQKDVHSLVHYHYTAWPDYGQPVDTQSLLNFHTEVKGACAAGPLVVHCSSGVGRTGTFIALDYLLDQATAEGGVDVFECVKRLRCQRMNMVHHQRDYELLHDVLALALGQRILQLKITQGAKMASEESSCGVLPSVELCPPLEIVYPPCEVVFPSRECHTPVSATRSSLVSVPHAPALCQCHTLQPCVSATHSSLVSVPHAPALCQCHTLQPCVSATRSSLVSVPHAPALCQCHTLQPCVSATRSSLVSVSHAAALCLGNTVLNVFHRMFTRQQFRLMLVLLLSFKEEIILGFIYATRKVARVPSALQVGPGKIVKVTLHDTEEFLALHKYSNQRNDMKPYRLNNDINTSGHQRCFTKGRTVSQCRLDRQQRSEVQHNHEISDCMETKGARLKHMAKTKEQRYRRSLSDGHEVTHQSRTPIGYSRTGQTKNGIVTFNHTGADRIMSVPRFSVYYDHQLDASETFRPTEGLQQVGDRESATFEVEAMTPACGGQVGLSPPRLKTTAVACRHFTDYIHRMRLYGGFIQQFEELPKGELAMCADAKRPANLGQNRFKNMHPYDHCRVILPGSERASDYINASHINGYGKPRFYIATQGPLPETTADFWDMVRHYEATTIIMLTNILENDRMKCVKYWPDVGTAQQYGGSCVQTVREEIGMDYSVRTMFISEEGGRGHQICQYHYTAWPDHGQPSSDQSLLDFHYHARATFGAGPVIVHCSAGIGRTGTFIALDYLLDQATAESVVDVFQCVKRLRYQRMNMVQTAGQYEFLHDVLELAFLKLPMDHNC
ncbi:uncharacterized protein LOC124274202 [Haliotis rubra]|uniref:uncharacterized protein LOC124274202 n=1 Tax=Haliotis rubra TaxID=36100 RepID=UPI001EE61ADA|nr:uncharacterized protein LOC124274202 [Haliotis rubra]